MENIQISNNTWKPRRLRQNISLNDKIVAELTSYLNRLTIDNYSTISNKICLLEITDIEMMDQFVKLIFDKAVKSPTFCKIYANLVSRMQDKYILTDTKKITFRYRFLILCQSEFKKQQNYDPSINTEISNSLMSSDELKWLYHRRIEGTLLLFASLYKVNIMNKKLIKEFCLNYLFDLAETNIKSYVPESLCNMIKNLEEYLKSLDITVDEAKKYIDRLNILRDEIKKTNDMRIVFLFDEAILILNNITNK